MEFLNGIFSEIYEHTSSSSQTRAFVLFSTLIFPFYKMVSKVHKIENFYGSDFEFCVISLLVMLKY
jgi:hypothetical protein